MPRIRTTSMKRRDARVAAITACLTADGRKWSDLQKLCGFSNSTAKNRKKHPEDFKVSELNCLPGLTDQEIIKIVRGQR